MSTPAEGEWLYDTTRKAGVWGDGSEDDGIPAPNFAEIVNNTWTGFAAVQNGSPADPNDLTITIDERFNKAAFLNGATFKTFARFYVKIPANNTGAVNLTVEFGSGGSTITKDLKKIDAAATPAELDADDLVEGGIYSVMFDGTQWLVVGGLGGGGAGSWELVESQSFSSVASVQFTTGLDSTANTYAFLFENITGSTSTPRLVTTVSTDGGSSYKSSNYRWVRTDRESTSAIEQVTNSNGDTSLKISGPLGTTANLDSLHGWLYLGHPAATDRLKPFWGSLVSNDDSIIYIAEFAGFWPDSGVLDTSAINAINFYLTAGTMSGRITLYRIKHD